MKDTAKKRESAPAILPTQHASQEGVSITRQVTDQIANIADNVVIRLRETYRSKHVLKNTMMDAGVTHEISGKPINPFAEYPQNADYIRDAKTLVIQILTRRINENQHRPDSRKLEGYQETTLSFYSNNEEKLTELLATEIATRDKSTYSTKGLKNSFNATVSSVSEAIELDRLIVEHNGRSSDIFYSKRFSDGSLPRYLQEQMMTLENGGGKLSPEEKISDDNVRSSSGSSDGISRAPSSELRVSDEAVKNSIVGRPSYITDLQSVFSKGAASHQERIAALRAVPSSNERGS